MLYYADAVLYYIILYYIIWFYIISYYVILICIYSYMYDVYTYKNIYKYIRYI